MNVFLVGPMGAGKSTIGRHLAKRLKRDFYDCDIELTNRCGVDVPTIFDFEGEHGFRQRESQLLDELTQMQDIVMATGGGAVLNDGNRTRLKSRGTVVYLRVTIEQQLSRTAGDKNRPLLQGDDPRATLEAMQAQREPLYVDVADHVIDTSDKPPQHVARAVAKLIEKGTLP
ncbi:MAG: shikimate kinase AroK [Pseudomonadota bacterium]